MEYAYYVQRALYKLVSVFFEMRTEHSVADLAHASVGTMLWGARLLGWSFSLVEDPLVRLQSFCMMRLETRHRKGRA